MPFWFESSQSTLSSNEIYYVDCNLVFAISWLGVLYVQACVLYLLGVAWTTCVFMYMYIYQVQKRDRFLYKKKMKMCVFISEQASLFLNFLKNTLYRIQRRMSLTYRLTVKQYSVIRLYYYTYWYSWKWGHAYNLSGKGHKLPTTVRRKLGISVKLDKNQLKIACLM